MGCVSILILATLFSVTVSQLEITANKYSVKEHESVIFTCKVPDFTDNVFVVQDSNSRAVCYANSACSSTNDSLYTATKSGTTVIFEILSFSKERDEGSWIVRYGTNSDSNPVEITAFISTLFVAVVLIATGIVIGLLCLVLIVFSLTGAVGKHIYRRIKRKSLKDYARLLTKSIMACHGDTIILTGSHRLRIIEGNTKNVHKSSNDTVLHLQNVTEQHLSVYKCGILLESIGICKEVIIDHKVLQKKDESGNGESSMDVSVVEKTRKEIKIEFHFEVDNEDLVTFREPSSYYFTDKHTVRGVTFTGIQIIVFAAIYQLIAMISTAIFLSVVYYEHKEYDTLVVIPVAVTIAVLFPLLSIGVYIWTVICCRKLKNDTTNDLKTEPQCVKTGLLLIIIIFPLAWFVLFVMVVVNKCRQSPNDGNDDKTKENQSTVEETRENHNNGIRLSLLSTACCQNSVDAKEDAKEAASLSSKSIWDNKRKAELTSITVDAKAIKNGKQISKTNETENQAESHHAET